MYLKARKLSSNFYLNFLLLFYSISGFGITKSRDYFNLKNLIFVSLHIRPIINEIHELETDSPPPSQPASSLGGPPTASSKPAGSTSGMLLLVGVASGTAVVLLNVLLIGCCLHRRTQNRIKRGTFKPPVELLNAIISLDKVPSSRYLFYIFIFLTFLFINFLFN